MVPCTIVMPKNVPTMRQPMRLPADLIQKSDIVAPYGSADISGRIMPISWFSAPEGYGGPIVMRVKEGRCIVYMDEKLKSVVSLYMYLTSQPPVSLSDEEDDDDDEDTEEDDDDEDTEADTEDTEADTED